MNFSGENWPLAAPILRARAVSRLVLDAIG
jgi:hypothetical protein